MTHDQRTPDWWNTIDFQPAPPGWRVVYLHEPVGREIVPIAGWLIQERYNQVGEFPRELNDALDQDEQVFGRQRRVIAGCVSVEYDWSIRAVDQSEYEARTIWHILPPGAPEPSEEEEEAERAARARHRDRGSGA